MRSRGIRQRVMVAVLILAGLGVSSGAFAEDEVKGVITAHGRDGTLMVRSDDATSLIVVLEDFTKVRRTDGLREMKMSSANLIPGLRVELKGSYLAADRFAAEQISFSRADLKMALAIKGGVDQTSQLSAENQKRIEQNIKTLEQQRQQLQHQELAISANRDHIRSNNERLASASTAIDATNTRITNLADHDVASTLTVYFKNGSASIARKHKAELEQLAARAKMVRGYVIQVEGHASAVGPDTLNQRLSMQRAHAVAAVLSQHGIPPTHMLVPATMATSKQIADNKTAKGRAENRRVVVTLLQNKGLTDSSAATPGRTNVERVTPTQR